MPELNEINFTAAIEAAVAEKGSDYIYPAELKGDDRFGVSSCLYFDSEKPEVPLCIIGNAISRLGYSLDDVKEAVKHRTSMSVGQDIDANTLLGYLGADSKLASAAREAQVCQDCGDDWGTALNAFKHHISTTDTEEEAW